MTTENWPLSERMRDLALRRDDLPDDWLALANRLDDAAARHCAAFITRGDATAEQIAATKALVSAWAKARKAWCAATGEPLA